MSKWWSSSSRLALFERNNVQQGPVRDWHTIPHLKTAVEHSAAKQNEFDLAEVVAAPSGESIALFAKRQLLGSLVSSGFHFNQLNLHARAVSNVFVSFENAPKITFFYNMSFCEFVFHTFDQVT